MTLPLRILHLEDDPFDAKLIKLALDEGGIDSDMCCVMTINDFVASLESCGFDLVLSDYSLPGFDGLSALSIVKERFPHMPFVFVSGNMGEERAIESLKKGATDYVLKNNMARLAPSVLRALRETQERSEREQAEEALKKSEQKYRMLYENLRDGSAAIDMSGRLVEFNLAFQEMLGYSEEEIYRLSYHDITPERWRAAENRILREQVMTRGFSDPYQKEYIKKDGTIFPVELTAYLVRNEKGAPTGMWAFIRDITLQKQAEQLQRKFADEINDLYNNAPCGYHSLDKDGVFVRINNTELSWLGYTRDEVIGKMRFPDIITPGSLKLFKAMFPVFKKQGWICDLEYEMVRKDGSILPVLLSSAAIKDAEGNFIMGRATMFDIAKRKEIEKHMASTNELLKLFSQKASAKEYFDEVVKKISIWSGCECVGIRVLNEEGMIPYGCYTGFSREFWESENLLSIRGDQCACTRTVKGDFEVQDMHNVTSNGSFHCNNMMDFVAGLSIEQRKRYRGTCVKYGFASVTIIPIRHDDTILGAIHIADKTENRLSMRTLESIESLSHIIGEAVYRFTLEAERSKLQSERARTGRLASIGELAAGVAHEINNPMTGIISCAEMLLDKYAEGSKEKEIANRIIKEGVRVADIVKGLLSFARQGGDDKRPVRIEDIISEVLALTKAMLKKDGVEIKLSGMPELLPVIANFQQIEQVFLNVIDNSRYALTQKYDGTSGDKQIRITFAKIIKNNMPYVRTIFLDNGTGISRDLLDKVADPFFSTKPAGLGTGLGLSISHGIITDHNGMMTIESVEGNFTKVIIDLPASRRGEDNEK